MAIPGPAAISSDPIITALRGGPLAVADLVPAVAFAVIFYYAAVFCRKYE